MKQTSFIVKNLGGNLPKKQSTIIKRNFRSSTKPLSLDSSNLVDKLAAETFYLLRTSEFFNIWILHPQSQLESPTDFKNLLKVFFTVASLWWLLGLQLLHQWNFQIYFETLWYGEIEKTWLQNPSSINRVFLFLKKPSNRWLIMSFKYRFKWISIRVLNEQVMDFFALLIFVDLWSLIDWTTIELVSRTKSW